MAIKAGAKSRFKQLLSLPKLVTFQNPDHFSPRIRDLKAHGQTRGNFSGPIKPEVLEEARRTKQNKSSKFEEPTSPKISCMGQIKNKKKIMKKAKTGKNDATSLPKQVVTKKKPFSPERIRKADVSRLRSGGAAAPGLGQLKKYASGRDALCKFDWSTAQITPEEDGGEDRSRCFSEEEEEVIIAFSAPIIMSQVKSVVESEPKKEINLWKRRTMAQPPPLQLK